MLTELYRYALDKGLAAQPGFKPKRVKAYVLLSASGEFLGIHTREKDAPAVYAPDREDRYTGDMLISLLGQLLLTVLREAEGSARLPLRTANAINNENEVVGHAQRFIGQNVRMKLSVPMVAREVGVSPSYLTALFHKNLQISPGEYIRRAKLQESKLMIREGKMNFTEIAQVLQYSTVHHFSRQFKEKFGITPTEYARSIR